MDWASLVPVLKGVGVGIVSGVITALLGYAKNSGVEDFDPKKAVQTIVVGGFVGGVAGYVGVDYAETQEWLSTIGALTVFEYVKKAVVKRIFK